MSMSIIPSSYIMPGMSQPWFQSAPSSSIINPIINSIIDPSIINRSMGYDISPIIQNMMAMAIPSQIQQQIGDIIQGIDSSIVPPMPTIGKDGIKITMDVGQFKPSEITVKSIEPNIIMIVGKHEERQDEIGSISREFSRKYILPKDYDINTIIPKISSDGILIIKAPAPIIKQSIERIIPIKEIGPIKKGRERIGSKSQEQIKQ